MVPEENTQTDYIQWNTKLEIGIPAIDEQHKKLVGLCNNLYRELMKAHSSQSSSWQQPLIDALHACTDYVQTHFHDEEILMKAAGYPDFQKHKHEHDQFTLKILQTVNEFDTASFSTAMQFVKFLYDWILSHIAHEDTLYVKSVINYIREKNLRIQ